MTIEKSNPIPRVIQFQFNPDSMSRSLQGQGTGGGGESNPDPYRLKGPPSETISLEIELDATDRLEHPRQNPQALEYGILPELANLELLLYTKSEHAIGLAKSAALGILEIIPPEGPFTIFVWGAKRILPVQVTKFDITEEAWNTKLNPIRAKISLGLRVLNYSDFSPDHPGFSLFSNHHISKENMSNKSISTSLTAIGVGTGEILGK